ncbi:MAG: hypothetical protein GAK30_01847 [Paracidovorax wautersii]|uniref:Xylose isomerase-like TIM barrel domain-containing protein n=1 Tax=Paracidovorax wautersii TaxID=1177982 RepID=A0A7V8FP78_9BURK|nr:MAG: hypothetical protein GAK30_01847 [Paracidovorax wautersii]
MRDFTHDSQWLSLNTATLRRQRGQDVPLARIIDQCAAHGVHTISPWRDQVQAAGLAATALDAPCLVLVVGALPGALAGTPGYRDIARARAEVRDGIAATLAHARDVGMPLAIEPLHPMQAADRACVNTLEHALDLCDELDAARTGLLGVALDVYHVWWDPKLQAQIARAGADRLLAYHVCDWRLPTRDLLADRGMMGDGIIELRKIRGWVEAAGFAGCCEVEIFSEADWWQRDGDETLAVCIERHRSVV